MSKEDKCLFCSNNKIKEDLLYIPSSPGLYENERGDHYHQSCLGLVANSPERFPTRTVDIAIDLIDRITDKESLERRERNIRKGKVNLLTTKWERLTRSGGGDE